MSLLLMNLDYPVVMTNIAIENGHLQLFFPLKMVMFHSYVILLEGNYLLTSSIQYFNVAFLEGQEAPNP